MNDAFRTECFFADGDRTDPEKVRALLHKGKFLLVEDGGELTGCVYVELRGERGYFGLLAVDPAAQRSGLGSRMVAAAEEHCRAAACRFMDLTIVNLRKECLAFYRRLGYVESGTLPFPADQNTNQPCHLVKNVEGLGLEFLSYRSNSETSNIGLRRAPTAAALQHLRAHYYDLRCLQR